MNILVRLLCRVYGLLLGLYPRHYRAEYGTEMRQVFHLTVNEAAQGGALALIKLGLCELRDLPRAVIREHVRAAAGRRMIRNGRVNIGTWLNRGLGVWAVWVLVYPIAYSFTVMAAVVVGRPLDNVRATVTFAVPVFSIPVTIAQWLVLVYRLSAGGGWLVASLLGWAAGCLIAYVCNTALSLGWYSRNAPVSALLVVGLMVGVAQWMVLRRRSRRAIFWIPASVAGWVLVGFAFQAATTLCATVVISAIPAAMTGVVLAAMVDLEGVGY